MGRAERGDGPAGPRAPDRLESTAARARRVRALLDLGRHSDAIKGARACLAEHPEDPELLELFGLCLLRAGDYEAAVAPLADARQRTPAAPHVAYLLGYAKRRLHDSTRAEAEYREALRLAPEEPVYLRALAELLSDNGRADEALTLARKAVELAPDRPQSHVTLGYCASAARQTDLAAASYRQALAIDPNDSSAWNNLGCVELAEGDRLGARESFREALRLDPEAELTRFDVLLGEALVELAAAGRLGSATRVTALVVTVGRAAAGHAFARRLATTRLGPLGVAAGAAVVSAAARSVGVGALLPLGALAALGGVGWVAASRRITPLRRRLTVHVTVARARWNETRQVWLAGQLSRAAREAEVDRVLERLAVAFDREPDSEGGPHVR